MIDKQRRLWLLLLVAALFIPIADLVFEFSLPYDYFVFLRIFSTSSFVYLAFKHFQQKTHEGNDEYTALFGGLVLLYNPVYPIGFTREVWTVINLITGLVILNYWRRPMVSSLGKPKTDTGIKRTLSIETEVLEKVPSKEILTKRNSTAKDTVQKTISLITEPLLFQRALMLNSEGSEYLKSDEALGFVSGFIDGFLQISAAKLSLSGGDEELVMAAVLGIVFENTHTKAGKFFALQSKGEQSFFDANVAGGTCAFKLFSDPKNREAQMGWYLHYRKTFTNDKNNSQEEVLEPVVAKPQAEQMGKNDDKRDFARDLRNYYLSSFGAKNLDDLPHALNSNDYIAGFATGYLAIVIDGVLGGRHWTKAQQGNFGLNFMNDVFQDKSASSLKGLHDLEFAKERSLKEQFTEGRDHGSLLAATHYEVLKADLNEPLIDACRNLCRSSGLNMPTAVFALTLQKYVLLKWPNEIGLIDRHSEES